jgi:hypothetical protein
MTTADKGSRNLLILIALLFAVIAVERRGSIALARAESVPQYATETVMHGFESEADIDMIIHNRAAQGWQVVSVSVYPALQSGFPVGPRYFIVFRK